MNRWTRTLATLALATTLSAGLCSSPAFAQEPTEGQEGEESKGRPVDGYIATSVIAFGILFIVGKSARR